MRRTWLAISFLCFLCLAIVIIAVRLFAQYRNIPQDYLIGNRASTLAALKEKGFPFSFFVIGDTQSGGKGVTLIEKGLSNGEPSFIGLVGDFVKEPNLWHHRFFLTRIAGRVRPRVPVFLAAGNHDIDYTGRKIKRAEWRTTQEVYRSLYGSINFDFVFNNCLFIFCGVDLGEPRTYLNYLRDVLGARASGRDHIFIFLHFPPAGLASHIPGPLPFGEEFLSLVEKYEVRTCFFGDYHGYWRGQSNGVNFIITGGGGRFKGSQPEWGRIHHILRVTVWEKRIGEEMIVIPDTLDFWSHLELWIFVYLLPLFEKRGWMLYGLGAVFLFCGSFSIFKFFRVARIKSESFVGRLE